MQVHMASGCADCTEIVSFLQKVWSTGQQPDPNVPEEWSQKAEAIMRTETLGRMESLPVYRAVPAFGGLALQPSPLRADSPGIRSVTYETPNCVVDLRIEEEGSSRDISIVGQITDRRSGGHAVQPLPIYLLRRKKLLAHTFSNEFGEFQLGSASRRDLSISFPFDGFRIDVKLDPPSLNEATSR